MIYTRNKKLSKKFHRKSWLKNAAAVLYFLSATNLQRICGKYFTAKN